MRPPPAGWTRFWFAPTPTSTLAVVRIAYGIVLVAWTLSLSFDASPFLSTSGLVPERPRPPWTWSVLDWFPSDAAVGVVFALLLAAAVAVLIGYRTRLAAAVVVVCLLSLHTQSVRHQLRRRVAAGVRRLPRSRPCGCRPLRRPLAPAPRRPFWDFPERSPLALRLMQLQLSAMYLFAVWAKLRGTTWNNGTAVSYALRVEEVSRIDLPAWFTQSVAVSNALTFGTLATEVALATLVWNRRARPWVLGLGVAMHLLIDLSITVGFFSFVVFVGYLAFVPADTMSRWILAVRDRLRRSPLAASPTPNPSGPDPVPVAPPPDTCLTPTGEPIKEPTRFTAASGG